MCHPYRLGQLSCILGTSARSPGPTIRDSLFHHPWRTGIGAPPGFAPSPVVFGDGLAEVVNQNVVLWVGKNAVPKLGLL
jgi:hypothetical protein